MEAREHTTVLVVGLANSSGLVGHRYWEDA